MDRRGRTSFLTENGRVVSWRDATGDCHQEHRHIEHCRNTQGHLLPGLRRDEEDEERDDVDENGGLDVVKQEELGSPPHNQIISRDGIMKQMLNDYNQLRDIRKFVFAARILLLVSFSPKSLQLKHS